LHKFLLFGKMFIAQTTFLKKQFMERKRLQRENLNPSGAFISDASGKPTS